MELMYPAPIGCSQGDWLVFFAYQVVFWQRTDHRLTAPNNRRSQRRLAKINHFSSDDAEKKRGLSCHITIWKIYGRHHCLRSSLSSVFCITYLDYPGWPNPSPCSIVICLGSEKDQTLRYKLVSNSWGGWRLNILQYTCGYWKICTKSLLTCQPRIETSNLVMLIWLTTSISQHRHKTTNPLLYSSMNRPQHDLPASSLSK